MNRTTSLIFMALTATLLACNSGPSQKDYEDESKSTVITSAGGGGRRAPTMVKIPVSVEYGAFGLLGTPATAYEIDLDGCLSGYTATVTEANLDGVEVYKDDRNCLAKLISFTVGGVTYELTDPGATDFTTWADDDTALFIGGGGEEIRVKVVSQLESPIAGTEAVVYNFSDLLDADSDQSFSEADVSDVHAITVEGQEAPKFKVASAAFVGMDNITGAPEFDFKLECVDDPTSATPTSVAMDAGSGADTLCSENDLEDITYKLVKDTYGSVLTITDAEAIFSAPGQGITIPADQYQDSPTNEGFQISALDGPGGLGDTSNANMILILKAGISFTYYNVDVQTITQ